MLNYFWEGNWQHNHPYLSLSGTPNCHAGFRGVVGMPGGLHNLWRINTTGTFFGTWWDISYSQEYHTLYVFAIFNSGECIVRQGSNTHCYICTRWISLSYNFFYYYTIIWTFSFVVTYVYGLHSQSGILLHPSMR